MTQRLKAIIFDMDGVLFLSQKIHAKAFQAILREFGIQNFRYETCAGMRTEDALKKILTLAGLKSTRRDIDRLARKKRWLASHWLQKKPPIRRGCLTILTQLRRKFILALASSASKKNVELFMRKSRCRRLFSASLSGEDVEAAKPHPQIYKTVLKLLHLYPQQALVVEDSVAGAKAARRAGIPFIGITGTTSAAKLKRAGATKIIRRLSELTRYAEHF